MNTDDEERLRVLNEIRAYGKAAPFAHTAPAQPRENIYDASMREWVHSKTFRTMITLVVVLPLALICFTLLATTCAVLFGGYAIIADVQRILSILGLGG